MSKRKKSRSRSYSSDSEDDIDGRVYLKIPLEEKYYAKKYFQARWNPKKGLWHISDEDVEVTAALWGRSRRLIPTSSTFREKTTFKKLGGRWNASTEKWCIEVGVTDPTPLRQWLSEGNFREALKVHQNRKVALKLLKKYRRKWVDYADLDLDIGLVSEVEIDESRELEQYDDEDEKSCGLYVSGSKSTNTPDDVEEMDACCVCLDGKLQFAAIKCGHLCLCETCVKKNLSLCPICRSKVQSWLKIFK